MRLARLLVGTDTVAAIVDDTDLATVLANPTGSIDPLLDLLRDPRGLATAADRLRTDATVSLGTARVLAPVHRPGKIIAIGLNYPDHTSETGFAAPTTPLTFANYPSSTSGAADDIVVPTALTSQVDHEVELAVVIGAPCPPDGSADIDAIAAYTVANDVSARDVQLSDVQWTRAKSFDTFTPLGPWLVTPDEIADPHRLQLWARVNGELVQDDTTASMVFDLPALLRHVSSGVSLEPGDVILTGTPAGAGGFADPPRYLADGDVVEVGVDGIGVLRNTVRFTA